MFAGLTFLYHAVCRSMPVFVALS